MEQLNQAKRVMPMSNRDWREIAISIREAQESIKRSRLRAQSGYLLGDTLNLLVEVRMGLYVVGLADFAPELGSQKFGLELLLLKGR